MASIARNAFWSGFYLGMIRWAGVVLISSIFTNGSKIR